VRSFVLVPYFTSQVLSLDVVALHVQWLGATRSERSQTLRVSVGRQQFSWVLGLCGSNCRGTREETRAKSCCSLGQDTRV
jgi:hypothetical protein